MKINYLFYIFLMFSLGILEAKEEFDSKIEVSNKSSDLSFEDKRKPLAEKTKASVGDNNSSQSDSRVIAKKSDPESQKSSSAQKNLIPEGSSKVDVKGKIEETFKKFLKILEPHPIESKEYKKAASFLEKTLYDEVSFDSLKLLSELYLKKEDIKGHLRVIKALSVSYPNKAESFYLLGKAHKAFSETLEDEDELEVNQKKIFENYRKALKLDPKYAPTYQVFLKELMVLDEESQELKHSKESLSIVMDMLKYLKEKQHYTLLCEAYYDSNFIRQTQKACVKSIKKNPNDPISLMTLAFSLSNKKKRDEKLLEIGGKYPNSFKTQYKIGLYFRKENSPEQAITHFIRASQIQSDHLRLHEILSRLLLRNNREEEAYSYFLKTCLLSNGVFLSEFRNALGILRRKKKVESAIQFDKGVKECFQKIKEERKQNKN